jgi:hypothetical protein
MVLYTSASLAGPLRKTLYIPSIIEVKNIMMPLNQNIGDVTRTDTLALFPELQNKIILKL